MPPEPLPWDRRDFRKHERSGADPRFGAGNFGGGGPQRWREQNQHPHQPPPHPSPYHHQNRHQQQQRWYSDFRSSRPIPPGHGKQGSWHMHSDEAGHGYLPFGSRYGDRNFEDENPRPFTSRNDGRYFRNSRENRGAFAHKDWKASSYEPTSPSGPGRPATDINNQKSVDNIQTPQNNNESKGTDSSHPPDLAKPLAQSHSVLKEQHDKEGGTADEPAIMNQKVEKENGLVSTDWKPLKWHRSGSLSSRGSGFSLSSSSKSMAVDSIEIVAAKNPTPLQSPSADAAISVSPGAPSHLDEANSRKKPRLGWGEGLAKYEKKKVDGPEECAMKTGLVISVDNTETLQSHAVKLIDKSPRGVVRLPDCASPTTPSSVACSSSPGVEEKESVKPVNINSDATKLSCSPGVVSRAHYDGPTLNLENLEMSSIANLSTLINEVLQSYAPNSTDTGYMQSCSMNKLLVLKVDTLKAIEVTESEIDSLETELKLLNAKPSEDQATTSKVTSRPPPLQVVSSGDLVIENKQVDEHVAARKDDDVDSPGSATSKYVELQTSGNSNEKFLDNDNEENTCDIELSTVNGSRDLATDSNTNFDFNDHCSIIWASNKDCANRAMEELYTVSPAKMYQFNISTVISVPSMVKEKFRTRKHFLLLKEKILSIKFKALSHFWKEGRVLSVRKLRLKSHKKFDHKKNRSTSRPRITFSSGSSQTVPADEVIAFVNNMLSTNPFKSCRNSLKMPALILDKKEMNVSRFISDNNLVADPCAVEKERFIINPWTSKEMEIFIDKLADFGKDFKKIASFLEHKTIADCVQFYYKNHKSELFERAKKKKPDCMKQRKPQSTTYLVASGKRWNRETNAASLDILGVASAIAANANEGIEIHKKSTSKSIFGTCSSSKASKGEIGTSQRLNSLDAYNNERETVAADVLAGICGSISSEAMSSCITSSVDPGDVYHQDWRYHRVSSKMPLTPDVTQSIDEECSDESCGEMGPADWTDEEKSVFIRAVSLYGKDFAMISRSIGTRNREQCKVYFSKARKCLGLDTIGADSGDVNGGGSDVEDACDVCNEGSVSKMEDDLNSDRECDLKPDLNKCEENNGPSEPILGDKPVSDLNIEDKECNSVKSACALPSNTESMCVEEKMASEGHNRELIQGQQLLSPKENLNVEKVEDANSSEASVVSCTVNEMKSDSRVSHPSVGANSLMQIDKVSESLNKAAEKSHLVPLQENGQLASMKSSTLFSVPIKYQRSPPHNSLSASVGTNRIYNKHSQNHSGYSLSDPVESLQILRGYPVSVQNKKPINSDVNCKRSFPHHDGIFHSDRKTGFSLQKCSSSNLSQRDHSRPLSSGSSDVPRNGDVKLFGKILTSSKPNTNSSAEQDTPSSQSLNLKFNGDLKVNSGSSRSKSEGSSFIGTENVPVNSCSFWNGNRIQTGFSTQLPDSALLLNKYPAAFSNYPMHTVKSTQSSIPSTSNGVFAIDMKQQQDVLFSEMQRRLGFDVMSGMQQQERGVVGRGVIASGVSDPVAAIKMHYANAKQFSLQNGNILKEDDL